MKYHIEILDYEYTLTISYTITQRPELPTYDDPGIDGEFEFKIDSVDTGVAGIKSLDFPSHFLTVIHDYLSADETFQETVWQDYSNQ